MPRSLTRPQTGQMVWYYGAAPPVGLPNAALVVNTVDRTTFGLTVFDRATGIAAYVPAVPFHYGTRPASGAWCTMIRVNEPASGAWPSSNMEAMDYELNGLDEEQREEHLAAMNAKVEEDMAALADDPVRLAQHKMDMEFGLAGAGLGPPPKAETNGEGAPQALSAQRSAQASADDSDEPDDDSDRPHARRARRHR